MFFAFAAAVIAAAPTQAGEADVVPVRWERFAPAPPQSEDLLLAARPLLNAARYNLAWAPSGAEKVEKGWRDFQKMDSHNFIRPICSASAALAVVLKTGVFDEEAVGVSRDEALARTLRLISAAAHSHNRESWRFPWQSAFWAADLAQAGWMLWDELDGETRQLLAEIAEFEANRFLDPDYRVPYWDGKGGDTKAEENAWNAMIHQIAFAMMPGHPNVPRWKEVGSELMVSAYALEEDLKSEAVVDGKPVKDWLHGYNVRADGAVINHHILHPDYMTCIKFNLQAHNLQSLAGQTVPEAADFRAEFIWRTLAAKKWPSPPNHPPGGAIYVPGQAEVYFPQGTDRFVGRVACYYVIDTWACVLGWNQDLPDSPASWMRLRADAIVRNQERHADRRLYADGELTSFVPREQNDFKRIADAYLALWLHARGSLCPTGNWLAQPGHHQ
ncbi:MAG TPA: hypothetical protein VMY37_21035 [Thermoguttaceae bacterium]|nr:hypothetical protein [Thermoguttaceae bacterium]